MAVAEGRSAVVGEHISPALPRRNFMRRVLGGVLAVLGLESLAATLVSLFPVLKGGLGATLNAGAVGSYPVVSPKAGAPVKFPDGKLWIVHLEQGWWALSQKCPHLGCAVPWCDQSGHFECPCHGSTYTLEGEWIEGPAPRGLDRYRVDVSSGNVMIDTSKVIDGPRHGTSSTTEGKPNQPLKYDARGPRCI